MKKQAITKWVWGALFAGCGIFFLIVAFAMDTPLNEKIPAFFMFSILLSAIFFWLSSLTTCVFQKNNPNKWWDLLIILLFNVFGAIYFHRKRQIRNYQPPKAPEIFNRNFNQWLDNNHFSLEYCIEQRKKALSLREVTGTLLMIFIGLNFVLKYDLFSIPNWLKPLVVILAILPIIGGLVFFLRYIYKDWKNTSHISFLLGSMFLQADASNNARGMMFFNPKKPLYKEPPLSFILLGDFFLFLSVMFGVFILGSFPGETEKVIYLKTGGITLASLFLLISFQFQTPWFIYFHPDRIFSIIKHYRIWNTASAILATLPALGFITIYIILFIQKL